MVQGHQRRNHVLSIVGATLLFRDLDTKYALLSQDVEHQLRSHASDSVEIVVEHASHKLYLAVNG